MLRLRLPLTLGFALLLALGCGGGGGGGGSNSGGGTPPVTVTVTSTSTAPTPTVTTNGTLTFTATVSNATNTTVTWSVQEGAAGGTITTGGVYTAPATSGTYHVIATPQADPSKALSLPVTVVAPPSITSFTAAKTTVTAGSATTLTAVFSGGTGSVDHSLGAATSGVALSTGAIAASTTFTLTVTNAAGTSVTATASVTAVAAPAITSFTANPTSLASGSTTTLTGVFSGGTGSVDQGVGAITSGVGKASAALSSDTTFTLTVTNAAGDFVTTQATVTVVTAPPTITTFTASPTTITLGHSSTLAWTVTGQALSAISIDQGVGAVAASGNTSVSPTTATTYTLTATNLKGTVTATATITVVFAPVINSFTDAPTTVTPGGASTLTPVFNNGTGSIDQGIGSVTSGTAYPTGALSADKTFTLTVTNAAGDSVIQSLTVHVSPGTIGSTGAMTVPRHFHVSTSLADGTVLITGGQGSSGYLSSAEVYDPAGNSGAGSFTATTGNLGSPWAFHTTVLLPNGKVLLAGGLISGGPTDSALLYDPASGLFNPSTHTLTARRVQFSAALLQDGRVLIDGGWNNDGPSSSFQILTSAEIYDPVADTFTPTTGDLGSPRWGHFSIALSTGKVLIIGGQNFNGASFPGAELFDPAANAFFPTAGPEVQQNYYTATLLPNGTVLMAGSGSQGSACLIYDPATGTTAPTGSENLARYSAPTVTLMGDGRALLAGDAGAPGFEVAADCEIYDPASGAWTFTANLGDRGQQVANLLPSGKVLLAGGFAYGATGPTASAVLYDAGPAVAAPAPSATVTAPASVVTGTTGHTASVPTTAGARYVWMIQGGSITAGLGTNSVTFTAGGIGTLKLDCLVTSAVGMSAHGSASTNVTP